MDDHFPQLSHQDGPALAECHDPTAQLPDDTLISPRQLARRWQRSERSLERDRATGLGVPFIRIGNSIRHRMGDVRAFENANRVRSTSEAA